MNSSRLLSLLAAAAIWLQSSVSLADASNLILNGASSYRDLGNDKFLAALYLELPSNNYDSIISTTTAKRMEMRLTSSYSKRRWVNLWMQGIAISNNSKTFNTLAEPLVEMFNQQKGGLEPGDIVAIEMADNHCNYQINGITLAEELPGELFKLFVNAWIGKAPPSADFRDAMLGKGVDASALQGQLAQIKPQDERISTITEWIAPPEPEIDEAELLAQQKAAEEAAALAAAEAEKEKQRTLENEALPTHAMLVPDAEQDPAAIALAAATLYVEQQQKAAALAVQQESNQSEQEEAFSVTSALALKDYIRSAKKDIYRTLKYPISAQRSGHEGQVRLSIEVDREGNLVNVEAASKSAHRSLDRAAIKAVKKAAPYQPLPDAIDEQTLSLTIPFKFTLVE
ncbi:MAG: TonB family protein [Porticoccaceae bacterium]|nr:TonB family protein [Porticoccaceae bacterium]